MPLRFFFSLFIMQKEVNFLTHLYPSCCGLELLIPYWDFSKSLLTRFPIFPFTFMSVVYTLLVLSSSNANVIVYKKDPWSLAWPPDPSLKMCLLLFHICCTLIFQSQVPENVILVRVSEPSPSLFSLPEKLYKSFRTLLTCHLFCDIFPWPKGHHALFFAPKHLFSTIITVLIGSGWFVSLDRGCLWILSICTMSTMMLWPLLRCNIISYRSNVISYWIVLNTCKDCCKLLISVWCIWYSW